MKIITLIFLLMPFWALNSFSQNADVTRILEKPETRTEIFKAVLNDHKFMMEFMNEMKSNDHAMMMMKENSSVTGNESKGDMKTGDSHQMMGMMKDNSEMMHQMMGNMMDMCEQDSTMCKKMTDMMSEHPHMMQMSMQKMKEKGMMDSQGKMKMMNSEDQKENKKLHRHQ